MTCQDFLVTLRPTLSVGCSKRLNNMANWQDIRELEERIYEEVSEYLSNQEAYNNAVLRVYLDVENMVHCAEVDNADKYGIEDEVYLIDTLIRLDDNGEQEVDVDAVSNVANSWIFLD